MIEIDRKNRQKEKEKKIEKEIYQYVDLDDDHLIHRTTNQQYDFDNSLESCEEDSYTFKDEKDSKYKEAVAKKKN